ncbi:cupin domain-containing protein [Citrobacter telavivensis]
MLVNHDFSHPAVVTPDKYQWVPSPQRGIERVMLDRIGAEQARATSIVKYLPNSVFPEHQHPDGEEILVISGVFSEGSVHYPAGWYLRNPHGSSHCPSSREGAVIFVKLRQMGRSDDKSLRINTNDPANWTPLPNGMICRLVENANETVSLKRVNENSSVLSEMDIGGAEILVLEGELRNKNLIYSAGTWIRFPPERCRG